MCWNDSVSAFHSHIWNGSIFNLKHVPHAAFLQDSFKIFRSRVNNVLKNAASLKINEVLGAEFEIVKWDKIVKYCTIPNSAIYREANEWFNTKTAVPILKKLEEFREPDSGRSLKNAVNLGINNNKFTPQLGSPDVDLPQQIKNKHACDNVKNNDDACFCLCSYICVMSRRSQQLSNVFISPLPIDFEAEVYSIDHDAEADLEFEKMMSQSPYTSSRRVRRPSPTYLTKNKRDRHVNNF